MELKNPKAVVEGMPVYVPGDNGELKLEIARATLKAGTMVVEFNTRLPAMAIQGMIAREGDAIGLIVVNMNDLGTPGEGAQEEEPEVSDGEASEAA